MSKPSVQYWGAVQTKASRETLAESQLSRQGFECWCPRIPKTVRTGRNSTLKLKPLFPGYVFVKVNLDGRWSAIESTIGVLRLIKSGSSPSALPHGFVEELRKRTDKNGSVCFDEALCKGDTVRLVSGAFDNWFGEVLRLPDNDRVTLLLQMVGRDVQVTVSRGHLVKAA